MMKIIKSAKKTNTKAGFTMVELLFAVANFAFIMMIAISAFIAVMQVYNKASFARQTQQAARTAIDQISRDVQSAHSYWLSDITSPSPSPMCIDGSGQSTCLCLLSADSNLVIYFRAAGNNTIGPKLDPSGLSGQDANYKIWRSKVDYEAATGSASEGAPGETDCKKWVDHILDGGWNLGSTISSTATPSNMSVSNLIYLPDTFYGNVPIDPTKNTVARYVLTIFNLKKGQSTSTTNDPFFDDFSIQNVTAFRE